MPGLKQLQQFNSDILNLGDEVKIRAARGEKPVTVKIPRTVEDVDDSEDFVYGLPVQNSTTEEDALEKERQASDFDDFMSESKTPPRSNSGSAEEIPDAEEVVDVPTADISADDLDLSDFEDEAPEPPAEEVSIEDMDLNSLLATSAPEEKKDDELIYNPDDKFTQKEEFPADEYEEIPDPFAPPAPKKNAAAKTAKKSAPKADTNSADELNLDDLDLPDFDSATSDATDSATNADDFSVDDSTPKADTNSADELNLDDLDLPDFDSATSDATNADDFSVDDSAPKANENSADELNLDDLDLPDFDSATGDAADSAANADDFSVDDSAPKADTNSADELNLDDLDLPDFDSATSDATDSATNADDFSVDDSAPKANENSADELNLDDLDLPDFDSATGDDATDSTANADDFSVDDSAPKANENSADELNLDDLDLPDFDSATSDATDSATNADDFSVDDSAPKANENSADASTNSADELNLDDLDLPDFDSATSEASDSAANADDFSIDDSTPKANENSADELNLDDLDLPGGDLESLSPEEGVPEEPAETFDTSDIDGLDFSADDGGDFALGEVSAEDDEFSIPGFSDTAQAVMPKKTETVQQNSSEDKPKNTFTDAEYKKFQKNLATYPLNVRIALEDFVVKNEFTDDAIFGVLEKVLRKAPARQVASELEKLLDISLDVPRDYEKRSAAEYEAYKKSLEYQLKNRIIPGAILTAVAAVAIFCIFTLTNNFVYKPLRASSLYKQGYALLEDDQYPQSEERFNQALTYRPVKNWFFKFAEGYRSHRQYDRARMMYRAIVQRYNHDKKAGLDWAKMEAEDLYNYEEGERIIKREVLDYHINDADAILALGDLYLDWATDKDESKFAEAKEQYDLLTNLYGQNNLYLSRQMRYFIRTDNLRQVLIYKEIFRGQKKAVSPQDQVELSGYLLDKRYGKLRPSEENLRSSIEDVRKMLESALTASPSDPIALYNMGRYFVATSNRPSSVKMLEASVGLFEKQTKRNKRDTYKYINAYRLLGEQKRNAHEYLTAEELYGKGIAIFENERNSSGFESDENIGKLYSDLADLDYFVSGDNDAALANYENAVNNKHDTSSVRYRIGYIQYQKQNYPAALGSFIRSRDTNESDTHLLLALANTLSLSNDNYVARGYYERLLSILGVEKEKYNVVLPQIREDHADLVDTYMKASNNLGVTFARIAKTTGDSSMNAKSIVNLQESLRAWDAMTRNQATMIRLDGSNLAEQNVKYITHPIPGYEPEIYTEIPRLLYGEEGFQ